MMEKHERLQQQIAFLMEIDKVKNIFRQTYLADGERKENDAEHSWHIALMAVLLQEHAEEEVDLLKVMTMVLIHDLVEIDAGDTYAYDSAGAATKRAREERRQIGSSESYRQIRALISGNSGKNLRHTRRAMQSMHTFLTISSHFF